MPIPKLTHTVTKGASVSQADADTWRLSIPAGPAGQYRLAQLDDYSGLARNHFLWKPPLRLTMQARVSHEHIPGTWGFGFWNDPFSLSLGFGGGQRKLPALPQTAWFFNASDENHLSLYDDLPAHGLLATTMRSKSIPLPILALAAPSLPLLAWPPTARYMRRLMRMVIKQDAALAKISPTTWHTYALDVDSQGVTFSVGGEIVLETKVIPKQPLGLVIWIDNQFAAFPPTGRLTYGMLASQASNWLEIKSLTVQPAP